jgi:hypothetical protein
MANEIKYLSYEGLRHFWQDKLKPEIEANELVVAASLVDLDDRLTSHTHTQYASTTHTHNNYLSTSGGTVNGSINPGTSNSYYLGGSNYKWYAVYASTFYGDLSGNATRATGVNMKNNLTSSVYYPMVFTNVTTATNGASLYIDNSTGTAQSSAGIRYNPSSNACYCSGGFFEASDERLKNFGDDIEVDLDKLSKLSKKYFTWKDDESNTQHIGVSAQEVQTIYPELVEVIDEEGHLSVSYDKLSVVAIKGIDVLNDKIKSLEERLEKLEKLIDNK